MHGNSNFKPLGSPSKEGIRLFEHCDIEIIEVFKNLHSLKIAYERMIPANKQAQQVDLTKGNLFATAQSIIKA